MNMHNADTSAAFSKATLSIDPAKETDKIVAALREQLRGPLRKRGLVLGLSGGIDSSVCAALAAPRAVGCAKNVYALFMPENDSDPESLRLGRTIAETFGIDSVVEDIGPSLQAMGCYDRRDAFIRELVPDYTSAWASKIVISSALEGDGYNISYLVVQDPDGKQTKLRMTPSVYLGIVAATNMKQRTRKQLEYFHADRLNFAVIGTPNRLEYDQGFFVKNGDGAADVKPIAHLYKTQVYQLAAYLGVPDEICKRPADDRHLFAAADAGRILLLPALRPDGSLPLRPQQQSPRRSCCGCSRPHGRSDVPRLGRHHSQAQGDTLPASGAATGRTGQ